MRILNSLKILFLSSLIVIGAVKGMDEREDSPSVRHASQTSSLSLPLDDSPPHIPLLPLSKEEKTIFILSIDGGGIRGLIPAIILDQIESALSAQFGYDVYISDFFDIVGGTSTGAIIGLGLLIPHELDKYSPKYRAVDLVELYRSKGKTIFPPDWWREVVSYLNSKYSADDLKALLIEYFQSTKVSQAIQQKDIFVPSYDITHNREFFFDSNRIMRDEMPDYEMKNIALATASAPTYFPAADIEGRKFVDGGVFMNNPTVGVYARVKQIFPNATKFVILSLGTGEANDEKLPEGLEAGGKVKWAPYIADVMMKGTEKTTESIMNWLAASGNTNLHYYRLQAQLSKAVLDKVDEKTLEELKNAACNVIRSEEYERIYTLLRGFCQKKVGYLQEKLNEISEQQVLDLNKCNVSGRFVEALSRGLEASSCTVVCLDLTECRINGDSLQPLCFALENNKTLTKFNLSKNGVGSKGITCLGNLLNRNPTLKQLSLQDNGIDDKVRGEIGSLIKNAEGQPTSLVMLDLSYNRIRNNGFEAILSAFTSTYPLTPIPVHINLSNNQIGNGYRDKYIDSAKVSIKLEKEIKLDELQKLMLTFNPKEFQFILKENNLPDEMASIFTSNKNFIS